MFARFVCENRYQKYANLCFSPPSAPCGLFLRQSPLLMCLDWVSSAMQAKSIVPNLKFPTQLSRSENPTRVVNIYVR